jgi:hypothetical protein
VALDDPRPVRSDRPIPRNGARDASGFLQLPQYLLAQRGILQPSLELALTFSLFALAVTLVRLPSARAPRPTRGVGLVHHGEAEKRPFLNHGIDNTPPNVARRLCTASGLLEGERARLAANSARRRRDVEPLQR